MDKALKEAESLSEETWTRSSRELVPVGSELPEDIAGYDLHDGCF